MNNSVNCNTELTTPLLAYLYLIWLRRQQVRQIPSTCSYTGACAALHCVQHAQPKDDVFKRQHLTHHSSYMTLNHQHKTAPLKWRGQGDQMERWGQVKGHYVWVGLRMFSWDLDTEWKPVRLTAQIHLYVAYISETPSIILYMFWEHSSTTSYTNSKNSHMECMCSIF